MKRNIGNFARNIVIIGFVSFFIDMSTEMVYPLIPLYLTAVLGATPMIVGVIEGIAESVASLLKVFSGFVGDRRQNKKKLTFIGYSASILYKLLLIVSTSWLGILFALLRPWGRAFEPRRAMLWLHSRAAKRISAAPSACTKCWTWRVLPSVHCWHICFYRHISGTAARFIGPFCLRWSVSR
jgi:predicted MFS family arabinose efflux permease